MYSSGSTLVGLRRCAAPAASPAAASMARSPAAAWRQRLESAPTAPRWEKFSHHRLVLLWRRATRLRNGQRQRRRFEWTRALLGAVRIRFHLRFHRRHRATSACNLPALPPGWARARGERSWLRGSHYTVYPVQQPSQAGASPARHGLPLFDRVTRYLRKPCAEARGKGGAKDSRGSDLGEPRQAPPGPTRAHVTSSRPCSSWWRPRGGGSQGRSWSWAILSSLPTATGLTAAAAGRASADRAALLQVEDSQVRRGAAARRPL